MQRFGVAGTYVSKGPTVDFVPLAHVQVETHMIYFLIAGMYVIVTTPVRFSHVKRGAASLTSSFHRAVFPGVL